MAIWKCFCLVVFIASSVYSYQYHHRFNYEALDEGVERALKQTKRILDINRNPRLPEDVDHEYLDKYHLVEMLTNTAIDASLNSLEHLNLTNLEPLLALVHQQGKAVTMRLSREQFLEFVKNETVEKEYPTSNDEEVIEITVNGEESKKSKTTTYRRKVVRKIQQYHWKLVNNYKWLVFGSNDPEKDPIVLGDRNITQNLITGHDMRGQVANYTLLSPEDMDLSWLLEQLGSQGSECRFAIERSVDTCMTPRRNEDVDKAFEFFEKLSEWTRRCSNYAPRGSILDLLYASDFIDGGDSHLWSKLIQLSDDNVFNPILPLMEEFQEHDEDKANNDRGTEDGEETSTENSAPADVGRSVVPPALDSQQRHLIQPDSSYSKLLLPPSDISRLLEEQRRTLLAGIQNIEKEFPEDFHFLARMQLVLKHIGSLVRQWENSVLYVEALLREQLIAAIGKEVNADDIAEYFRVHNQRLLGADKCKPFCYDIRRPDHYPDGILTIESSSEAEEPIETIVRRIPGNATTYIPLNAATTIEFVGDRYLHAWLQQRFDPSIGMPEYRIASRARQFSSFLLMVGTMSGPNMFKPKDAVIIQNKDQVMIPLLFEDLPTAKDFRDAIASLSPEQQRFAKSFRSMQLESSVFGICVVQLKPQLELLLGLPPDALTKEIQLTQDLLSLFIEYQIPSDLLTYEKGPALPDATAKSIHKEEVLAAVKGHVRAVMDVIDAAKKKQLESEKDSAKMRKARWAHGEGLQGASTRLMMDLDEGVDASVLSDAMESEMFAPYSYDVPLAASIQFQSASSQQRRRLRTTAEILSVETGGEEKYERMFDESNGDNENENIGHKQGKQESMTTLDVTAIPKKLDSLFEEHDADNALHTTVIKTGFPWKRHRQENLLSELHESVLGEEDRKREKNKAFDLLDALSRSGSLPVASGELHVIVGVAHTFEDNVMDTVIEKNVNPIEKIEKSTLLIASLIHDFQ